MQENHFLLLKKLQKYRKCPALGLRIDINERRPQVQGLPAFGLQRLDARGQHGGHGEGPGPPPRGQPRLCVRKQRALDRRRVSRLLRLCQALRGPSGRQDGGGHAGRHDEPRAGRREGREAGRLCREPAGGDRRDDGRRRRRRRRGEVQLHPPERPVVQQPDVGRRRRLQDGRLPDGHGRRPHRRPGLVPALQRRPRGPGAGRAGPPAAAVL